MNRPVRFAFIKSLFFLPLCVLIQGELLGSRATVEAQDYGFPESGSDRYVEPRAQRRNDDYDDYKEKAYREEPPESRSRGRSWRDFFSGPSESIPRSRYPERPSSRRREPTRTYEDESDNYRARYDDSATYRAPKEKVEREPRETYRNPERVNARDSERFRSGVQPRFMSLYDPDHRDLKFEYYYSPDRAPKGGGAGSSFNSHMARADLNVMVFQNEDFYFNWGATYGARSFSFEGANNFSTSLNSSSLTLHQAEFRPGIGYFFHRDFAFIGQLRLGAFGNLGDSIDGDSFQLLGEGLFVYRIEPRLQIVVGAARGNDFYGHPVVPLFGFKYLSSSGKWHLDVVLPRQVKASYGISRRVQAFGGLFVRGDKYRYTSSETDASFDISVRDTRIGGGLMFADVHSLQLGIEAGALVGNQAFRFTGGGSNDYPGNLSTKPYIAGHLGFSF